jgi:putative hydrolase of the HAD superfamily
MEKRKYKAIVFDLGGVLSLGESIPDMEGVHEEVAAKFHVSVDQYFDAIDSSYADAIAGKISKEKSINTIAKNLNTTPKRLIRIYKKAYKKNFYRNKELYNFALELKKKGYKIGIISDIWYVAKDIFFYKEYYKNFDSVLASCDVGARKTSKKIFQVSLKELGVKPSEMIFTDNEKWNMPVPRSLGIKTILFKNNQQFKKELEKLKVIEK